MSGVAPVTGAVLLGFDGKLPVRGDFVGDGLPRGFLVPWRAWVDAAMTASQIELGEEWRPAWMEAPVWHFALPGGACGPDAVLGLLMPSVDRVGRHYPLMVAAVFTGRQMAPDIDAGQAWLAAAEALALDALAHDRTPEALMRALSAILPPPDAGDDTASGTWWTVGSPRVPETQRARTDLPAASAFAGMIDARERPVFRSFAISHPGTKRQLNEDSFVDRSGAGLWAVADGVGGATAGDFASGAIRDALADISARLPGARLVEEVRQRLLAVHEALRAKARTREPPVTIASTVVALVARGLDYTCLWAGDSRIYLLRDGVLRQLTRDHSLVQAMVDAGTITAAEAEKHPRANVITRAVGAGDEPLALEEIAGKLRVGDRFLLCSDGLTKVVNEAEMTTLLSAPEGVPLPELLLQAALAHEAGDNVTVVTVEVRGIR